MNTAALPASAPASALDAEGHLVRSAARGDADAFGELFHRHSEPAWRLAQAVAPDRPAAAAAFRDGFVQALRAHRTLRRASDSSVAFRPEVLGAVYKAAVNQSYDRSAPATVSRRPKADPGVALADAAFRSLPERWRAAVWLSEVESMDVERIAPILGVSSAVATQLVMRGRRGLAGRYAQARQEVPEHIGGVLRAAMLATPTNLMNLTESRWAEAGSERGPIVAPVAGWLEDRAVRPMSVVVGALVGLGLIGLGVVPQGSPVRSQLGASGAEAMSGAVPVQTCLGLPCSTAGGSQAARTALGTAGGSAGGLLGGSGNLGAGGSGSASAGGSGSGYTASSGGGTGSGGGTLTGTTPSTPSIPATGTTPTGSTPGTPTAPSSSSTPSGGQSPSQSSGGSPTNPGGGGGSGTAPSTKTIVALAPIATVTSTGSALNVNLLPTSSGSSTATVTVGGCSTAVGVTVGSTTLGCPSSSTNTASPAPSTSTSTAGTSTSSTPSTSTSATSGPSSSTSTSGGALSTTVNGVTSTVGGVTKTVTNTLGSLTSGL